MDFYNALIAEKENSTVKVTRLESGKAQTISGTGEAKVEAIDILNSKGEIAEHVNVGEVITLRVKIRLHKNLPDLVFGYMLKDRLGQQIFGTNTHYLSIPLTQLTAGEAVTLLFSFPANLGQGSYSVTTALHVSDTHLATNYEWKDLALVFSVINIDRSRFEGSNWMPPHVERK